MKTGEGHELEMRLNTLVVLLKIGVPLTRCLLYIKKPFQELEEFKKNALRVILEEVNKIPENESAVNTIKTAIEAYNLWKEEQDRGPRLAERPMLAERPPIHPVPPFGPPPSEAVRARDRVFHRLVSEDVEETKTGEGSRVEPELPKFTE